VWQYLSICTASLNQRFGAAMWLLVMRLAQLGIDNRDPDFGTELRIACIFMSLLIVDVFTLHATTKRNHVAAMLGQILVQGKLCARTPWRFSSHNLECLFGEVHGLAGPQRELTLAQLETLFAHQQQLLEHCKENDWPVRSSAKSEYGMRGLYHRQDRRQLPHRNELGDGQILASIHAAVVAVSVMCSAGGWETANLSPWIAAVREAKVLKDLMPLLGKYNDAVQLEDRSQSGVDEPAFLESPFDKPVQEPPPKRQNTEKQQSRSADSLSLFKASEIEMSDIDDNLSMAAQIGLLEDAAQRCQGEKDAVSKAAQRMVQGPVRAEEGFLPEVAVKWDEQSKTTEFEATLASLVAMGKELAHEDAASNVFKKILELGGHVPLLPRAKPMKPGSEHGEHKTQDIAKRIATEAAGKVVPSEPKVDEEVRTLSKGAVVLHKGKPHVIVIIAVKKYGKFSALPGRSIWSGEESCYNLMPLLAQSHDSRVFKDAKQTHPKLEILFVMDFGAKLARVIADQMTCFIDPGGSVLCKIRKNTLKRYSSVAASDDDLVKVWLHFLFVAQHRPEVLITSARETPLKHIAAFLDNIRLAKLSPAAVKVISKKVLGLSVGPWKSHSNTCVSNAAQRVLVKYGL
jgi:hypothetical protein